MVFHVFVGVGSPQATVTSVSEVELPKSGRKTGENGRI
jgi:hypothetical protein